MRVLKRKQATRNQMREEIELLFEIYASTDYLTTIDKSNLIILSKSGEVIGKRVSGKISAPSAERICRSNDSKLRLDSRLTVQTQDKALISINFNILSSGNSSDFELIENGALIQAEPVFVIGNVHLETSDVRYQWINQRQAIGKILNLEIGAGGFMRCAIYAF